MKTIRTVAFLPFSFYFVVLTILPSSVLLASSDAQEKLHLSTNFEIGICTSTKQKKLPNCILDDNTEAYLIRKNYFDTHFGGPWHFLFIDKDNHLLEDGRASISNAAKANYWLMKADTLNPKLFGKVKDVQFIIAYRKTNTKFHDAILAAEIDAEKKAEGKIYYLTKEMPSPKGLWSLQVSPIPNQPLEPPTDNNEAKPLDQLSLKNLEQMLKNQTTTIIHKIEEDKQRLTLDDLYRIAQSAHTKHNLYKILIGALICLFIAVACIQIIVTFISNRISIGKKEKAKHSQSPDSIETAETSKSMTSVFVNNENLIAISEVIFTEFIELFFQQYKTTQSVDIFEYHKQKVNNVNNHIVKIYNQYNRLSPRFKLFDQMHRYWIDQDTHLLEDLLDILETDLKIVKEHMTKFDHREVLFPLSVIYRGLLLMKLHTIHAFNELASDTVSKKDNLQQLSKDLVDLRKEVSDAISYNLDSLDIRHELDEILNEMAENKRVHTKTLAPVSIDITWKSELSNHESPQSLENQQIPQNNVITEDQFISANVETTQEALDTQIDTTPIGTESTIRSDKTTPEEKLFEKPKVTHTQDDDTPHDKETKHDELRMILLRLRDSLPTNFLDHTFRSILEKLESLWLQIETAEKPSKKGDLIISFIQGCFAASRTEKYLVDLFSKIDLLKELGIEIFIPENRCIGEPMSGHIDNNTIYKLMYMKPDTVVSKEWIANMASFNMKKLKISGRGLTENTIVKIVSPIIKCESNRDLNRRLKVLRTKDLESDPVARNII